MNLLRNDLKKEIEQIYNDIKYDYTFATNEMLINLRDNLKNLQIKFDEDTEALAIEEFGLKAKGFKIVKKSETISEFGTEPIPCPFCNKDCEMDTEYEGSAVCKDLNCEAHKDEETEKLIKLCKANIFDSIKSLEDKDEIIKGEGYYKNDVKDIIIENPVISESRKELDLVECDSIGYIMNDGKIVYDRTYCEVWFSEGIKNV